MLAAPSYQKSLSTSTLASQYQHLNGKKIRSITIEIREIFDEPDAGSLYRTANNLKISTRQEIVERELLFHEGDLFDAYRMQESERVLRELRFLRKVSILPIADGDEVDVIITAQDTWTLIPQLGYSSGDGRQRYSAGIVESNLLGLGKRAEVLFEEDENRTTLETVWEDRRVLGTSNQLLLAYFDRDDGERFIGSFGRPFRTLYDRASWSFFIDRGDTIGRLFEGGDERYIFRQQTTDLNARYTISHGNPESEIWRYAIGYDFMEYTYEQADQDDYDSLGLDPDTVSNDIRELPVNRRYTGPKVLFQYIDPMYISENYVDRFDRVEDYNIGLETSGNVLIAPETLGSLEDALLLSGNISKGYAFSRGNFMRSDFGGAARYSEGGFEDKYFRAETRYYNVVGPVYLGGMYLGLHTFATSFFLDYGSDLDKNREFTLGGDNALRGYQAKTFSGDKRYALNLEERVHIAEDLFQLVSFGSTIFAEVGGATDESLGDLLSSDSYGDVGAGLRFAFPRSSGGSVLRIDFAVPFRDGPDDSGAYELRIIFAGGQLFSARTRSETYGPEKASVAVGLDR